VLGDSILLKPFMMNGYVSGWFYDVMSLRLIAALEDMGVTELIVGRRRHMFLQDESAWSVTDKLSGLNIVVYHFGSMTEGTTTPGMGSDIDTLHCHDVVNIMSGWPEWERGRDNLLMVKHETCSPQHYRLQETRPDLPLPLTQPYDEYCVTDNDGKIYRSNKLSEHVTTRVVAGDNLPYVHAGPSHSWSEMLDFVYAYRCRKLPAECDSWFTRSRPGQWPTQEMLQVARELGCFLIPDGHCDSEYSSVEWRVSPSLIERHLMFSMGIIHLQCYVTLKLLKKDTINPYLNGNGKLTSFHCKTVLFYAREQLLPEMWTVDRLFDCIIYCLKLLRDWTISGHCPHYIMDEVNLFDGKLNSEQRDSLHAILDIIIDTHLAPLASVETDNLGVRLLHNVYTVAIWDMTPRRTVNEGITGFLSVHGNVKYLINVRLVLNGAADRSPDELCLYLHSLITDLPLQQIHRHRSEQALCRLDAVNRDNLIRYLQQHLASTAASICLQHGTQLGTRIWSWYSSAMDTDVASTRLKLASMLYCKGDLQMAADVLEDVERRYDSTVQAMCGCGRMDAFVAKPLKTFSEAVNEENIDVLSTNKVAYCVRFLPQEAFCVPPNLQCEMVWAVGDDIEHRIRIERDWINWAVVDSRPFLYYLQYLAFRGLGLRHRQLQALRSLGVSIRDGIRHHQLFHLETATHIHAHCMEMENRPDLALRLYQLSQSIMQRNNAANWHIQRLTNGL